MQGGKQCIKRVAHATAKLRTQIQRWRKNNPTQEEKPEAEAEVQSLADVQADIDATAADQADIENEFQDDTEGKTFRDKAANLKDLLKQKVIPHH